VGNKPLERGRQCQRWEKCNEGNLLPKSSREKIQEEIGTRHFHCGPPSKRKINKGSREGKRKGFARCETSKSLKGKRARDERERALKNEGNVELKRNRNSRRSSFSTAKGRWGELKA